jgi:competence protein ComEC
MPLLWLGFCIIAGILVSDFFQAAWYFWVLLFFSGVLISIPEYLFSKNHIHPLLSKKLFGLPFGLLLAAFALGGWRFQSNLPNPEPDVLAYYQPLENAVVTGSIISFPELSSISSSAVVKAESILIRGQEKALSGNLDLRLPSGFHLAYGDKLRLEGDLKSSLGKGEALTDSYLTRRGILSEMAYPQIETLGQGFGNPLMASILHFRDTANIFIENQLPLQESSLLSGILLGIDWRIPRFLEDAYRATGTVHIIAISGFNISLISGLIIRLFRRIFSPVWARVLAILTILGYTLMVGAEPSVVRAAIMGSLSIPAYYIGRRVIGLYSLTFAAAVMVLINPLVLWDIGFQMSFLATLGLMVLVDPLVDGIQSFLVKRHSEKAIQAVMPALILFIASISAQFAVSPMVLGMNPNLQIFSLAANMMILPLQPPIMILGGLAVLLSSLFPIMAVLLLRLAWIFAFLSNQLALHFALTRFAEIRLPGYSAWIAGVLVFAVIIFATIRQIRMIAKPALTDNSDVYPI